MFTLVTLLFVAAFLFGLRRSLQWDSPGVNYEICLYKGLLNLDWRPEHYNAASDNHRAPPGLRSALIGNDSTTQWWFTYGRNRYWVVLGIPLWIPAILATSAAGICWWRDRQMIVGRWARLKRWLAPRKTVRLRVIGVVLFTAVHFAIFAPAWPIVDSVFNFFLEGELGPFDFLDHPGWLFNLMIFWAIGFMFAAPAWGLLWAWLWTRWMNKLRQHEYPNGCKVCGYDLTGNTSGRCPECGLTHSPAPS